MLNHSNMATRWKAKLAKAENNMAKDGRKGEKEQWMEELE